MCPGRAEFHDKAVTAVIGKVPVKGVRADWKAPGLRLAYDDGVSR